MRRSSRGVTVAVAVYCILLRAYPRPFRLRHGQEMEQVFRDCCREVTTGSQWFMLWIRTLTDLAQTAWQERIEAGRVWMMARRTGMLLTIAVLAAIAIGYVNVHTDETPYVALPLWAITMGLSVVRPRLAPCWLLIVGLSVPVSQIVMRLAEWRVPYSNAWSDIRGAAVAVMLTATVSTAIGCAIGTVRLRLSHAIG